MMDSIIIFNMLLIAVLVICPRENTLEDVIFFSEREQATIAEVYGAGIVILIGASFKDSLLIINVGPVQL